MVAVIVTGPPASGKTVLAGRLSSSLHLPLFSRDAIKERLFDELGVAGREWSSKLGAASFRILFSMADSLFAAQQRCILETNFSHRAAATLQEMAHRHNMTLLQVFCLADVETLRKRFEKRALSGERHPGHVDADRLTAEGDGIFTATAGPLPLEGPLIEVDTTHFAAIDHTALAKKIETQIRLIMGVTPDDPETPSGLTMMIDG
jgi:predicted kinase